MHELGTGTRRCRCSFRRGSGRRRLDVVGDLIDQTVVDSDGSSIGSHTLDRLGRVSNETLPCRVSHDRHLLEIPIRPGIVRPHTEIVILGITVGGRVDGIQSDVGRDGAVDSSAKSTDLEESHGNQPKIL